MKLLNILKQNNIIKVSPDDHLSHALAKLSTSHDAAFVFDPEPRGVQGKQEEKYLGVISPYYCIIKSSHPGNAKVINCLTHPPKIYLSYPLAKVCELFIQSKIHYLPVFEALHDETEGKAEEKFLGVVSVRRVLSHLRNNPIYKVKIAEILKNRWKPLLTIKENDGIGKALHIFKTDKISKLIVVNEEGKLKGILAYYDFVNYMMGPKFKAERGERVGNKTALFSLHVKTFAKSYVLTIDQQKYLSDAISYIIDKKIGSVLIVDKDRKPLGIITSRDILQYYINKEKVAFFKRVSSGIDRLLLKKKT